MWSFRPLSCTKFCSFAQSVPAKCLSANCALLQAWLSRRERWYRVSGTGQLGSPHPLSVRRRRTESEQATRSGQPAAPRRTGEVVVLEGLLHKAVNHLSIRPRRYPIAIASNDSISSICSCFRRLYKNYPRECICRPSVSILGRAIDNNQPLHTTRDQG